MNSLFKIVLGIVMLMCLFGCSARPIGNEDLKRETTLEGESVHSTLAEIKEMSEANITGCKYKSYHARVHEISEDILVKLFSNDREVERKTEYESQFYSEKKTFSYFYNDGTIMYYDCGVFSYKTEQYNDYPVQYFLDKDVVGEAFPNGVEYECPKQDLWFMTFNDAIDLLESYLDEMGVQYGNEWICYPVKGEVLTRAIHRHYPDEEYQADLEIGYKPVKREFSEVDDVYIMRIPLVVEGIEISQEGIYAENQTYSLPAGWAQAIVGSTGLWYLEVWHAFDIIEESEEKCIIPENEAISLVADYCSHLIGVGNTNIESRGIYYVPVLNKVMTADAFELIPMWIVDVTLENGSNSVVYVNAHTGKVK